MTAPADSSQGAGAVSHSAAVLLARKIARRWPLPGAYRHEDPFILATIGERGGK